jgi:TPR repeat protein
VVKDKKMASVWFQKAFEYFRQKAEQGAPEAQNRLGKCYENGYGVAKNEKLAVRWYRRAAKQGYWLAQLNLSCCYAKGRGVAKNRRLDEFWYGRMLKSTQSF